MTSAWREGEREAAPLPGCRLDGDRSAVLMTVVMPRGDVPKKDASVGASSKEERTAGRIGSEEADNDEDGADAGCGCGWTTLRKYELVDSEGGGEAERGEEGRVAGCMDASWLCSDARGC